MKLTEFWLREYGGIVHMFDVTNFELLGSLREKYPGRVFFGSDYAEWEALDRVISCSLIYISVEGPKFTLERVLPNVRGDYVSLLFYSEGCSVISGTREVLFLV